MSGLDLILRRLDVVRRSQRGWRARCPAHGSRGSTLSVAEGERGVVLHCFAGCWPEDVLAALGLRWADVLDGNRDGRPPASSRVRGREPNPAEWEAIWARLGRESAARAGAYCSGKEPIPFRLPSARPPRSPLPALTRDDFDHDRDFAAYERWRRGNGRLPVPRRSR